MFMLLFGCGSPAEFKTENLKELPSFPELIPIFEVYSLKVPSPKTYLDGTPQAFYDMIINTDSGFRKMITFFDKTYFIFGSEETFYFWWHEVHWYYPWEYGAHKGMFVYTGKYQVWIPGKRMSNGQIIMNPFVHEHEDSHFLNMLDEEMADPHMWILN